jgi:hypothetical protein
MFHAITIVGMALLAVFSLEGLVFPEARQRSMFFGITLAAILIIMLVFVETR